MHIAKHTELYFVSFTFEVKHFFFLVRQNFFEGQQLICWYVFQFVLILGWLVSTALACTVIYGIDATTHGPRTPQWLAVAYNAATRFAFSLSVAWVMFVCITGNGGKPILQQEMDRAGRRFLSLISG